MSGKRTVAVVTGTRAEFGILQPVVRELEQSKKWAPALVVTGMHLQRAFGYTVEGIEKSAIRIAAKVSMYRGGENSADALARGVAGLAKAFRAVDASMVMVLGDRLEVLAAATAALAEGLPVAHLHGGESARGTWDEQIRHAVTKIAHVHFCATKLAGRRLRQLGEDSANIHVVGAPALDTAMGLVKGNFTASGPAVMLLHPSSSDDAMEKRRAEWVLAAMDGTGVPFVILGTNNDPGHSGILAAYAASGRPVRMSVSQGEFFSMLAAAPFLIGNSSAGLLEAASFGTPVINLGDRQQGRERNTNVVDVAWPRGKAGGGISAAIQFVREDRAFLKRCRLRKNIYGDGTAAKAIRRVMDAMPEMISTTKGFYDL